MQENAGVADVLAAVGALAPLVFDGEMVVAIFPGGGDIAEAVAREMQHAVLDHEDAARVGVLGVLEPGGQAGEIFAALREAKNKF